MGRRSRGGGNATVAARGGGAGCQANQGRKRAERRSDEITRLKIASGTMMVREGRWVGRRTVAFFNLLVVEIEILLGPFHHACTPRNHAFTELIPNYSMMVVMQIPQQLIGYHHQLLLFRLRLPSRWLQSIFLALSIAILHFCYADSSFKQ